jgi:putative ABC transport system permease protein
MNFITQKDLGYNEEQVVVIPTYTGWTDEGEETVKRFRNRFEGDPAVIGISGTSSSFNQGWSRNGYKINGEQKAAYVYRVDESYLEVLDIELIAGRNFDPAIPSDKNSLIINEALARDMGYENPLAERLDWHEDSVGFQIIGVVKDYNFLSLEYEIDPMFIMINPDDGKITTMLVKLAPGKISEGISKLQTGWNELAGDKPFDYTFLDEDVAKQYESYSKWTKITGLSTFFAILIASLGLFGLSGINASNRTKEIGIRKVLGASVSHIIFLMTRYYVILSFIAFMISAPLSWYIMEKWLSDFKYTISLSWELFVISMAGGLLITLLTVSYHSIKSTVINPSDTLRYE